VKNDPPWQEGTLAIRPERIRVCQQRPVCNAVLATILELIYRGDHIDVFVDEGGLRVRVPPSVRLAVGQRIWLELPMEHLEVLDD